MNVPGVSVKEELVVEEGVEVRQHQDLVVAARPNKYYIRLTKSFENNKCRQILTSVFLSYSIQDKLNDLITLIVFLVLFVAFVAGLTTKPKKKDMQIYLLNAKGGFVFWFPINILREAARAIKASPPPSGLMAIDLFFFLFLVIK